MDAVVAAAAGNSVQLLGKAWNEPLAPAQTENPHWDLDQQEDLLVSSSGNIWEHA